MLDQMWGVAKCRSYPFCEWPYRNWGGERVYDENVVVVLLCMYILFRRTLEVQKYTIWPHYILKRHWRPQVPRIEELSEHIRISRS